MSIDAIVSRLKSAPKPPCTCGMDDNLHETTCAIYEYAQAWQELAQLRAELATAQATIDEARELLTTLDWNDYGERVDVWLAAHPAPEQTQEQAGAQT